MLSLVMSLHCRERQCSTVNISLSLFTPQNIEDISKVVKSVWLMVFYYFHGVNC